MLYSYVLTDDNGFAPNPFWDYLTLACCMPEIRRNANKGDWIVGIRGKKLYKEYFNVKEEENYNKIYKIIYIMKVTEEPLEFYTYYDRFKRKIPDFSKKNQKYKIGDNCYKPIKNDYKQLRCAHSNKDGSENIWNKNHDLDGLKVLISRNFYYFGNKPIIIPDNIKKLVKKYPNLPNCGALSKQNDELINPFLELLASVEKKYKKRYVNRPHFWNENDYSWKSKC